MRGGIPRQVPDTQRRRSRTPNTGGREWFEGRVRPLLLAAVLSVAAAGAAAQVPSPEVRTLAGALALRGTIDAHRAVGCSLSSTAVTTATTIELSIDASGAAELHVAGTEMAVFGPNVPTGAPGEFRYQTYRRDTHLTGTARFVASTALLELELVRESGSEASSDDFGGGPLPAPTVGTVALRASCRVDSRPLLDAAGASTPTPVAVCTFSGGAPSSLARLLDAELVLGEARGVRLGREDGTWSPRAISLHAEE